MRTDLFDFDLPADRIALRPASPRDAARLLVVRPGGAPEFEDRGIADLPDLLAAGRLPGGQRQQGDRGPAHGPADRARRDRARDRGDPAQAARRLALAGLHPRRPRRCRSATRCASAPRGKVCFLGELDAQVSQKDEGGEVTLSFSFHGPVLDQAIAERGAMPLPPYIASRRAPDEQDRADYQTVFAMPEGSVAAPTAGLHFTDDAAGAAQGARGRPCTR